MNILIVACTVLPLLALQTIIYRKFIDGNLHSAASGTFILSLIFVRTGLARISGGEVPESAILNHPDNDWLRFLLTSPYAYGTLHLLLLLNTIWFYFEVSRRVKDAKIKRAARKAAHKTRSNDTTRLVVVLDNADVESRIGASDKDIEIDITEYIFKSFELETLKIKNFEIENLLVNWPDLAKASGFSGEDINTNTIQGKESFVQGEVIKGENPSDGGLSNES
jgi:hypothetical protein